MSGIEIRTLTRADTAAYAATGFETYGIERKALKLADGRHVDEELRMLELTSG